MEENVKDSSRPQMYLFGCSLKADKKEHKVVVDDDDEAEHQLSLKSVCLGSEAEDKFHTVEMEGLTYDGKSTKITCCTETIHSAFFKSGRFRGHTSCVLPSTVRRGASLHQWSAFCHTGIGRERFSAISQNEFLQKTVHSISGSLRKLVDATGTNESDDEEEEENNTSPVKRPSNMTLAKVPQKKLKMDSEDEDEESEEDDDEEEDDVEEDDEDERAVKETPIKAPQKTPQKVKDKSEAGPFGKSPSTPNIRDVKNKLASAAKEGRPLPKTEQKFENYAKSSFKISDKQVIKDLWNFLQSFKQ